MDRLSDGIECTCEIGIINRKRQHGQPQCKIFPSSIRPLQHRVEELGYNRGEGGKEVKGTCNLSIINGPWTLGRVGAGAEGKAASV